MVKVMPSLRHKTRYRFNMIGPWTILPQFMGLLEDNYIYEEKEGQQETVSQEILQDKNISKTKKQDKGSRKIFARDS